jgi:hypothetical protein
MESKKPNDFNERYQRYENFGGVRIKIPLGKQRKRKKSIISTRGTRGTRGISI